MNAFPVRLALAVLPTFLEMAPLVCTQVVGGEWPLSHQIHGDAILRGVGHSIAGSGDINLDGYDDLLIGAKWSSPPGMGNAGAVLVVSGKDATHLLEFWGASQGDELGISVANAGDVNADGVPDIIAVSIGQFLTHSGQGTAFVYSGANGQLLHSFQGGGTGDQLGWAAAGAGDLDQDGYDDFVLGAPHRPSGWGYPDQGYIIAYSGRLGSVLYVVWGTGLDDQLGSSVASIADLDGDGIRDLLVGAPGADLVGLPGCGVVRVYSGATGVLIRQIDGVSSGGELGQSISSTRDLDGDGVEDILAGAPRTKLNGQQDTGASLLFSGASGSLLHQFVGVYLGDYFGSSAAGVGDLDDDGTGDLLIGAVNAGGPGSAIGPGAAYLYSGKSKLLLRSFHGSAQNDSYGASVADAGDMNADGRPDIAMGAPWDFWLFTAAGLVEVYSYDLLLYLTSSELSASSGQAVDLTIDFPWPQAGAAYTLLASNAGTGPIVLGGIEVPLSPSLVLSHMLSGWTPPNAVGWRGRLNPSGNAAAALHSTPALAPLIGKSAYLAVVSYNAGTQTARMSSAARPLQIVP